ncbi:MAG: hypothetical protein FJX42_04130, partial [Alphaproteobacteria bacterium]|nr:hypothetical protein [Alphaproteobacteria bacterium]
MSDGATAAASLAAVFAALPVRGGRTGWDRLVRAFRRYGGTERTDVYALTESHFQDARARWSGDGAAADSFRWIQPGAMGGAGVPPILAMPGAPLAPFAWRRRTSGLERAYSLVGVVDSLSAATIFDDLPALTAASVEPWDAVVCSSRALGTFVSGRLREQRDWIQARAEGPAALHDPLIRTIPPGVSCDQFAESNETREVRDRVRRGLGIGPEDAALLLYGRFGYRDRFHPLAFYRAAETAAIRSGANVFLIHAGRFVRQEEEREFREVAREFAPHVRCIFLDGDDPAVRGNVWFAAD